MRREKTHKSSILPKVMNITKIKPIKMASIMINNTMRNHKSRTFEGTIDKAIKEKEEKKDFIMTIMTKARNTGKSILNMITMITMITRGIIEIRDMMETNITTPKTIMKRIDRMKNK